MSHFGVDLGIEGVRSVIVVVVVDYRICTGNIAQIIIVVVDRATCNGTERDATVAVRIHISFFP